MDGFLQQTPLFVRLETKETKEKTKGKGSKKGKTFGVVTYHFPSDHTPGCEVRNNLLTPVKQHINT